MKTQKTQITITVLRIVFLLSGSGQGSVPPRNASSPCRPHWPAHAEDSLLLHAGTAGEGGRHGEPAVQRAVQGTKRGGILCKSVQNRTNLNKFLQIRADSYGFIQTHMNSYKYAQNLTEKRTNLCVSFSVLLPDCVLYTSLKQTQGF